MTSTVFTAEIFQIGAGLSGYVADIGASFLCADLGLVPELEPRADHASYVASWLAVLQDDRRAIFAAAAHAQRAVAYLHGLQPRAESEREAA
ncbi:zincin-like metallopeptidase domain-containing protein [Xanthobacter versatilis]|uniref:zincin-like metallopeptidase domain-containing protein n=1 Tax=Xanthobacter autotrophicus (strain ATCC BAA-1158 / Py2) TaxID=78245 RepID=UPI0040409A84